MECEVDVVFTMGGLSVPKSGMVPEAGLLEFNTEGAIAAKSSIIQDHDQYAYCCLIACLGTQ